MGGVTFKGRTLALIEAAKRFAALGPLSTADEVHEARVALRDAARKFGKGGGVEL